MELIEFNKNIIFKFIKMKTNSDNFGFDFESLPKDSDG